VVVWYAVLITNYRQPQWKLNEYSTARTDTCIQVSATPVAYLISRLHDQANNRANVEQLEHKLCTRTLNAFAGRLLDDCLMFAWSCKRGINHTQLALVLFFTIFDTMQSCVTKQTTRFRHDIPLLSASSHSGDCNPRIPNPGIPAVFANPGVPIPGFRNYKNSLKLYFFACQMIEINILAVW